MVGEWMCRSDDNPGWVKTVGALASLMGYDIGLPALWDHDQSSSGLGTWSLMAEGSWNRAPGAPAGSSPAMLDAFSKSYQGWITPTGVFGSLAGAPIPAAATSPTAYRCWRTRPALTGCETTDGVRVSTSSSRTGSRSAGTSDCRPAGCSSTTSTRESRPSARWRPTATATGWSMSSKRAAPSRWTPIPTRVGR